MRKNSKILIWGMMILCNLYTFAHGQRITPSIDPEREVIVMFKNNAVIPPANRTEGRPDEFQIQEQALRQILLNAKVEAVSRLIPDFLPEDKFGVSRKGEEVQLTDWTNVYVIRFPQPQARAGLLKVLKNRPEVIFAEPNGRGEPDLVPNDQYFNRQWALKNDGTTFQGSGNSGADINATTAWDITTGSSSIKIGIVDGGMQTNHPDFTGRVTGDVGDSDPHGTAVAGVAAAKGNNAIGVAGVAWNVGIINEDYSSANDADFANAVRSAANRGADVINNSWKLMPVGRYSIAVRLAFADVYKQNRTAVASMGNQYGEIIQYPAAFGQGIITVGATTNKDVKADYSSTGNWIDVTAPGGGLALGETGNQYDNIFTTVPGSNYDWYLNYSGVNYNLIGTSFAAPVVTGIAALLLSVNSSLYNDDIEQIIRLGVDDKGDPDFDNLYGTGRVNARAALDLINESDVKHWTTSGGTSVGSTGTYTMTFFSTPGLPSGAYIVKRYDVQKTVTFPQTFTSVPHVWGRGVASNGFSGASPNFGMGWCNVVSGSVTQTGATLQTYVYKVYSINGQYLGYYPTSPGNVTFAYTALGDVSPPLSVSVIGPSSLGFLESGSFTAYPSGGNPNYSVTYQWYKKEDGASSWSFRGSSNPHSERMVSTNFNLKVVATKGSETAEATKYVTYGSGGGFDPKILMLPESYALSQNFPNPFNPITTIKYELPGASFVTLVIYDLKGNEVTRWSTANESAGYKRKTWNATDKNGNKVPAGMYLLKMTAESKESEHFFTETRKMLLLK